MSSSTLASASASSRHRDQLSGSSSFFTKSRHTITLPNELLLKIIESKQWTNKELAKLARVNKTFLAITRPLLYRSIKLTSKVFYCRSYICHQEKSGYNGKYHDCEYDEHCEEDTGSFDVWTEFPRSGHGKQIPPVRQTLKLYPHLASLVEEIHWNCDYAGDEYGWDDWNAFEEDKSVLEAICEVMGVVGRCAHLVKFTIETHNWRWSRDVIEELISATAISQLVFFDWIGELWDDLFPRVLLMRLALTRLSGAIYLDFSVAFRT